MLDESRFVMARLAWVCISNIASSPSSAVISGVAAAASAAVSIRIRVRSIIGLRNYLRYVCNDRLSASVTMRSTHSISALHSSIHFSMYMVIYPSRPTSTHPSIQFFFPHQPESQLTVRYITGYFLAGTFSELSLI